MHTNVEVIQNLGNHRDIAKWRPFVVFLNGEHSTYKVMFPINFDLVQQNIHQMNFSKIKS